MTNRKKPAAGWGPVLAVGLFAILWLGSGCASSRDAAKAAAQPGKVYDLRPPELRQPLPDSDELSLGEQTAPAPVVLPMRAARPNPATVATPKPYSFVDDMLTQYPNPDEKADLALSFDSPQEIRSILDSFAKVLDFQYLLDPAVTGTVSINLELKQVTRGQLWHLLEDILWMQGAYVTRRDAFLHVLPIEKMPQEKKLLLQYTPQPNVQVTFINVENADAGDLVNSLKPFVAKGATVTNLPKQNALLLIESPENMPKLLELIRRMDVLAQSRWPAISRQVQNIEADVLAEELRQVLPTMGFPVAAAGSTSGPGVKIAGLKRAGVLVASAPTVEVLREVEQWIDVLDRQQGNEQDRVFFYEVRYTKAQDLSEALSAFFKTSGGSSSSSSSRSAGGSSSSLSRSGSGASDSGSRSLFPNNTESSTGSSSRKTENRAPTPTAAVTPVLRAASTEKTGEQPLASNVFDTPVSLFVDGTHNRLVLRTTPRAYVVMRSLLKRLDAPPLQASIQVSIAEITLTNSTSYGFKYAANKLVESGSYKLAGTSDYNGDGTTSTEGLNIVLKNVNNPDEAYAFIEAVAGKNNTKILFSPQIIAVSDQQAEIRVGDQVPIVTSESNTSDSTNITRSIQYRDTGIILTVTPHITSEKMVMLELQQDVSNAVTTTSSTIDSPTIQTRSIQSQLVVHDGDTVLVGGLIHTENTKSKTGIPWLMNIPILGYLFGLNKKSDTRQELLLLLKVNVINMGSRLDGMLLRYREALQSIRDEEAVFQKARQEEQQEQQQQEQPKPPPESPPQAQALPQS